MKPLSVLLFLIFLTSPYTRAQNWMERDITQRVALWLQVRDGNWEPASCTFDAEDLKTGVFKMTFTPITLPGCATDPAYRVVVHPRDLVHPNKRERALDCSHIPDRQVTLAVAIFTPKSIVLKGGETSTLIGEPQIAVISGPIFTDSEYDWAAPSISPLERAQARLHYLYVEDVRPGRTTAAYTAFRAYSQAMKTQVEIRFDPADRDRFAIYTLGRDARCIKGWDDAAEEE